MMETHRHWSRFTSMVTLKVILIDTTSLKVAVTVAIFHCISCYSFTEFMHFLCFTHFNHASMETTLILLELHP